MHMKADTIIVFLIIALIMLAFISTVVTADDDRSVKNKDRPGRDKDDGDDDWKKDKRYPTLKPTLTPKPTLKPTPAKKPAPTPTQAPIQPPVPEPTVQPPTTVIQRPSYGLEPATVPATPSPVPGLVTMKAEISGNDPASPSPAPMSGTRALPTPLVSGMELPGPDTSIGTVLAVIIGIACLGYMAYLGSVMLRK
ncbi:MAG: hypothetical protein A4E28_02746 [Methanocella sp. PtaU1.Bin125]|nr:MAG: hypothetical protein A4E28_02746 [Methanocella sp. PtaU1.Bin125]